MRLELSQSVEAAPEQLRATRGRLRDALTSWNLDTRVANAVLDVSHELIANALRHGAPPVLLSVTAEQAAVRVEVRDGSREPARLLPYRPGMSEHGLGLRLVRQLSSDWGQTSHDAGKTVWAMFLRPAPRGVAQDRIELPTSSL